MSDEQTFPSRPASEGAAVTLFVDNEEVTLEAEKRDGEWVITPTSDAEAAALERFADSALQPQPSGYEAMTVSQLRDALAKRELPTSGNKDALLDRLNESDTAPTDEPGEAGEGDQE